MTERSTIIDPFFRALFDRLAPEIDSRMIGLASGSAKRIPESPDTVAEAYAAECATIQAYNMVLKICEEIEHATHGNRPPQADGS